MSVLLASRNASPTRAASGKRHRPSGDEFFRTFDIDSRTVGSFELKAQRANTGGRGRIDFLWSGELAIEHKSKGEDLERAMDQVLYYLPSLTTAEMPWLLIACDFERFSWRDLQSGSNGSFDLTDLVDHVELFAWMSGHTKPGYEFDNVEDVNLRATALLASIHDRLMENGYKGHALRVWQTRVLFCLFAEDAAVVSKAAFHSYLALHTRPDGSNLGSTIAEIFQWLDVPVEVRPSALDPQLRELTHINGDLVEEVLPIPVCDKAVRDAVLEACKFDWSHISPVIFGSMFQNVMQPADLVAHYTSERDIMRTIGPLFLDRLEADLKKASTKPLLRAYLNRLASLQFFDPACRCGSFLILAYRELRRLVSRER